MQRVVWLQSVIYLVLLKYLGFLNIPLVFFILSYFHSKIDVIYEPVHIWFGSVLFFMAERLKHYAKSKRSEKWATNQNIEIKTCFSEMFQSVLSGCEWHNYYLVQLAYGSVLKASTFDVVRRAHRHQHVLFLILALYPI